MTLEFADPVLAGGDSRHDEPLFGAHYLAIMRLCLRQLGDRQDAEDATQETFRRAIQQRGHVVGDPLPWLRTVARNVCVDELRRRRNGRTALERTVAVQGGVEPSQVEGESNPEKVVVGHMFVGELLGRLTPAERRVVVGRVLTGESGGEAAAAMGVTASTMRVLLSRATVKLRRYLEDTQGVLGAAGFTGWYAARRMRRLVLGRSWMLQGRIELLLPALVVSALVGTTNAGATAGTSSPGDSITHRFAAAGARLPGSASGTAASAAASAASATTPASHRAARPAPPAPSHPAGGSSLPAVLPTPDAYQVAVSDFEPSPSYASDHTILMVGAGDCYASCDQLYRSSDGGATWTYVPTQGFQSSQLLLPASSYAGGRFYGAGGNLLQVTSDGGASFQNSAPTAGFATAAPAWLGGQVVVANVALWLLDSSPAPQPLASFPPSLTAAGAPLLFPAPGGFLALEATMNYVTGGPDTLLRCSASGCAAGAQIPLSGYLQLVPSPDFSVDHTLAAIGGGVAISRDGGATFQLVSTAPVSDATIVPGPRGSRIVAVDGGTGAGSDATLTYSDDLGRTWHQAGMAGAAHTGIYVRSPRSIGPGQLIASAADARHPGMNVFVCSSDGAQWSACSAARG